LTLFVLFGNFVCSGVRGLWRFALCMLLVCTAVAGQAEPAPSPDAYILARGFWKDPSGQATFDTAAQQTYSPYRGGLSRGYHADAAHWIRFTVAASEQPLGLRVLPPWLDQVTLYDPATPGAPRTLGDRFPQHLSDLHGPGHLFMLSPTAQPRDIWLRLQTTSSHLFNAEILPLDQLGPINTQRIIWSVLYVSILLILFFVLLPVWWTQRDRLLGIFLVKHAVYVYYGAAYLGLPTLLLADWLPPAFFDKAFVLSTLLITPLALRFDSSFLALYQPRPLWLNVLKACGWVSLANVLLMLAGHASLALQLNLQIILVASVTVMLAVLSCQPAAPTEQVMPKRTLVAYYAIIIFSLPLGVISLLGWIEPREWSLYVIILHGLITGAVMAAILFVRAVRLANQSQQMAWQLDKARLDMALEQQRRQEQSQFLHMLMHELKTPLSVVTFALGTRQNPKNLELASSAVQDMKSIIDRCVQADQVGGMALDPHREDVDLHRLIQSTAAANRRLRGRVEVRADAVQPVHSDPQLLGIILSNLLDNAARYSDPVTPVDVALQPAVREGQAGVAVHVSNTPGLAGWPDADRIFTKYYRSAGAQRDSGSGLGLFLAQQLATNLGGSLHYLPTHRSVEFVLWIPQVPA
jgi:two-component system, sensor histidine kinase LadS